MVYIAQKKKWKKWPVFDQNHGLTPLEKCQFFGYLKFLFLSHRKLFFFSFQNIIKHISMVFLRKTKVGKMANFGPEPWTNPFGKMPIFRLFELLVFIAQKNVFSFQNMIKHIFLPYIAKTKQIAKLANFGPKPCQTKCQFFDFLSFVLFVPQNVVFSLQKIVKIILILYIA